MPMGSCPSQSDETHPLHSLTRVYLSGFKIQGCPFLEFGPLKIVGFAIGFFETRDNKLRAKQKTFERLAPIPPEASLVEQRAADSVVLHSSP